MSIAELLASGTKMFSFAGHVLGIKEMFDQIREFFSKSGGIPGLPSAPKGTEEERAFYSLLTKVTKKQLALLMAWFIATFLPPPNTGGLGSMEYNKSKENFFRYVLNIGDEVAQKKFLTGLAKRLEGNTSDNREEVYKKIEREYRVLGVPLPPEIHFDVRVALLHNRMQKKSAERAVLYKFFRDWF